MRIKKDQGNLFLTHENADPDAVGSTYFLKSRYDGVIGLPSDPDKRGKLLCDHLELDYEINPPLDDYKSVIIVDTPSPDQLKPMKIPQDDVLIIDHHRTNLWDRDILFEDRTSCAEIVYDLVKPKSLTEKEGIALAAGIMTDTSNFIRGDPKTFSILSEILDKSGVTLSEIRDVIFTSRTHSEKICRLKGAGRSKYRIVNGFIIAFTKVGSFESSVCNLLLNAGADAALTASQRNDEFLISCRADEKLVKLGLNLGEISKSVSSAKENMSGGGHEGAAVIKGEGEAERFLQITVDKIIKKIEEAGFKRELD